MSSKEELLDTLEKAKNSCEKDWHYGTFRERKKHFDEIAEIIGKYKKCEDGSGQNTETRS